MKTKQDNFARASALQITLSIALIFVSAISLVVAAPGNPKGAFEQSPLVGPTLGNYPDTSLALSTDTTVTPDAAPTNTTSINVSTSTDFKGTLAGDPTTGVVRVTDAHPAGTYTVTVTAFDSVGESATKTFRLTVTTPVTCNTVSFSAATNYGTGSSAYSVAVGDFNGDGKQDLAVTKGDSGKVLILLGDGAGSFGGPRNFAVGDHPVSVAVGDFNGDGKQDLAVANLSSDNVSILFGDGAGDFSAATDLAVGDNPFSVAVGDFNGDGKQDLAVSNTPSDNVSILLGDGAGSFSAPINFQAGHYPHQVVVGDFNGDGNQDLAVADYGSSNVSVFLGDGTGNFSAVTNFAVAYNATSVAVGDFNGDGKQDLAVAGLQTTGGVSILLGDGTGNFSAFTLFFTGNRPVFVVVGDFNGDGKRDLAVADYGSYLSILLGDGNGAFSAPTNFIVGSQSYSVAVGDFNGDGKQDLAVGYGSYIRIFISDCIGVRTASQITPAETTCSQFASGIAETLYRVQYEVNNDLIQQVLPHNFLYWVPVTVPAGDNTVRITQTITTSNFNTFFAGIGHGSSVFDSNCVSLERTGSQIGNTVQVKFNAPAAGTYFIGINFAAWSLLGQPAPSPATVHYDFTTTGVPDSTSGLDLLEH